MVPPTDEIPPPNTPPAANSNGGNNSPQRRPSLPSPWASIVRGGAEPVSSPPPPAAPLSVSSPAEMDNTPVENENEFQAETVDVNGGEGNGGQARRPAWNRPSNPSNGVVEAGPVMGGVVSWPALSESTRAVPRSWAESARPVVDGSVSTSQAPIIAQPPPQRTTNTNSHPHPAANATMPSRPRSRNRGGGSGGNSSGTGPSQHSFNRPAGPPPAPLGPPFPVFEAGYGMGPLVQDASVRGPRAVGNSQPHSGSEHSPQSHRNNSRRGNYGPRPRGDGQYHNNQGGRRDQDRRDIHLTPPFVPPPVVYLQPPPMPPPGTAPFMPPMRVYPGQMGFDMAPFYYPVSPESFRHMPINTGPQPVMFSPVENTPVANMIVKQIDYYFSDDNLVKDNYLRSQMDNNGWVSVPLIASFRRVHEMSKDINEILEALRQSTVVEIQGDKVRRRNDWSRWISSRPENSGPRTPGAVTENALATSLQQVSLDNSVPNANGTMGPSQGHTSTTTPKSSPDEETPDESPKFSPEEETTDASRLANGEEDASKEDH